MDRIDLFKTVSDIRDFLGPDVNLSVQIGRDRAVVTISAFKKTAVQEGPNDASEAAIWPAEASQVQDKIVYKTLNPQEFDAEMERLLKIASRIADDRRITIDLFPWLNRRQAMQMIDLLKKAGYWIDQDFLPRTPYCKRRLRYTPKGSIRIFVSLRRTNNSVGIRTAHKEKNVLAVALATAPTEIATVETSEEEPVQFKIPEAAANREAAETTVVPQSEPDSEKTANPALAAMAATAAASGCDTTPYAPQNREIFLLPDTTPLDEARSVATFSLDLDPESEQLLFQRTKYSRKTETQDHQQGKRSDHGRHVARKKHGRH